MTNDPFFRGPLTIVLIPEAGKGPARKVRLSHGLLQGLIAGLILTLCLAILGAYLLIRYRAGHVAYEHAQYEIEHLQSTLLEVNTRLRRFEDRLERLASFDLKLRTISQLRDPDRQLSLGPSDHPSQLDPDRVDSPFEDVITFLKDSGTPETPDELLVRVERLETEAVRRERSLTEVTDQLQHQQIVLAATPAIWPVQGFISSRFGMRVSPFTHQQKFHAGIDIAAAPGTPVYAPGDAKVVFVGSKDGYGKTLILDHGYGVLTCFAHNSEVLVKLGESVRRGQAVAKVGNTGRSTGPHLHYEVRLRGKPTNPFDFILN